MGQEISDPRTTHEVSNQVPPLEGINQAAADRALLEALKREGAGWAQERLHRLGETLAGEPIEWGFQANRNPPQLRSHDRSGHRIDEVEYHPAYHQLMSLAFVHEIPSLPWRDPRPGAHVARAALFYSLYQVEPGVCCPISMTYSVVPALNTEPSVAEEWIPRATSTEYDPRSLPASDKRGAVCGMAMTEKQGGSDVRANTTQARPLGDGAYEITGHKWFCSAPMSDAFLILAQAPQGLTCFLLPRWRPDDTRNHFHIQRLKDKLGDRANASSEVEFAAAWARRVGEEGRGVRTIIEMVNHTRLDCVIGSAAVMRQVTSQALHHAAHRSTFGKRLVDHALMANVLAELAMEAEVATLGMMRLARAYDEGREDEASRRFARLATAVLKYWTCKRAPAVANEALECLGGNGFVEESILPRMVRQAPLNSVWEGSGNVICLDVLRVLLREPDALAEFFSEIDLARGSDARLDSFVTQLRQDLEKQRFSEAGARVLVERMALALQGSLAARHADAAVAEAFLSARIAGEAGLALGTLPDGLDHRGILDRARLEP